MVTYLGGSILITIFALGGSIVSYNLHVTDQMIKDYIDRHESRDDKFGDFQVEN